MEVWSWGAGTDGQLGTASLADAFSPQRVPALQNGRVQEMACGGAHAAAVLGDGEVLTWGRGNSGQLGHGDHETMSLPKVVHSLQTIKIRSVAAGWSHTAFVSDCGGLYTCGDGAFGQLGLGDFKARSQPCVVTSLASSAISMAACGMRHTLVLMQAKESGDKELWAFGACKRGQLGVFPLTDDIEDDVESWQMHAKKVGRVCQPRRLTSLDEGERVEFVAANGDHSAALTESGGLLLWGRGYVNQVDIPVPARAQSSVCFDQIALGWSHGLGLSRDHQLFSWGSNRRTQLGRDDHVVYGSAQESKGQSLVSGEVTEYGSTPMCDAQRRKQVTCPSFGKVETLFSGRATWVAAGAEHSVAVLDNRSVVSWGWGEHGQLGLGDHSDPKLPQQLCLSTCTEHTGWRIVCGSGFTFLLCTQTQP